VYRGSEKTDVTVNTDMVNISFRTTRSATGRFQLNVFSFRTTTMKHEIFGTFSRANNFYNFFRITQIPVSINALRYAGRLFFRSTRAFTKETFVPFVLNVYYSVRWRRLVDIRPVFNPFRTERVE
jgi:hypothetical protein